MGTKIAIVFLVLVVFILLSMTVRIVRQFTRLVVFRLGRCTGARGWSS